MFLSAEKKCTEFPIRQKHPSGTRAEINIFPGRGKYRELLVIKLSLKCNTKRISSGEKEIITEGNWYFSNEKE